MSGFAASKTKTYSQVTGLNSKADTTAWPSAPTPAGRPTKTPLPVLMLTVGFSHTKTGIRNDSVTDGKNASPTIEPQASITWFGADSDAAHNDCHDVYFNGKDNVRTRLGMRFAFTKDEHPNFNVFAATNCIHNTKDYGVTISGLSVQESGVGNMAQAKVGLIEGSVKMCPSGLEPVPPRVVTVITRAKDRQAFV